MKDAKLITTSLSKHFKLTKETYPTKKKIKDIDKVPYGYIVGFLIYDMVYTRPYCKCSGSFKHVYK